jgi:hypothetical protein
MLGHADTACDADLQPPALAEALLLVVLHQAEGTSCDTRKLGGPQLQMGWPASMALSVAGANYHYQHNHNETLLALQMLTVLQSYVTDE